MNMNVETCTLCNEPLYLTKKNGKQYRVNESKHAHEKCYKATFRESNKRSYIYFFLYPDNAPKYVGQCGDNAVRLSFHINHHTEAKISYEDIISGNIRIRVFDVSKYAKTENERVILEDHLIRKLLRRGYALENKILSNIHSNTKLSDEQEGIVLKMIDVYMNESSVMYNVYMNELSLLYNENYVNYIMEYDNSGSIHEKVVEYRLPIKKGTRKNGDKYFIAAFKDTIRRVFFVPINFATTELCDVEAYQIAK